MYQQQRSGWLKHWDFAMIDIICLEIAFLFACFVRQFYDSLYSGDLYGELGFMLMVFALGTTFLLKPYSGTLHRDFLQELWSVVSFVSIVMAGELVFLFVIKSSETFSRQVILTTWGVGILFAYVARLVRKQIVREQMQHSAQKRSVALLVGQENALSVYQELTSSKLAQYQVTALLFFDETPQPELKDVFDIPLVYGREAAETYLAQHVVDELFVRLPNAAQAPEGFMDVCRSAGITIHVGLARKEALMGTQTLEVFGNYYVLTSSIRVITPLEALAKRIMDICGGLVGLLIAGVVALFVGPAIYLASPGPIIFSQTRIGRNGRTFKFYKFRSMYMDAEARKAELMSQNKMNGLMFKIDNDPRIIKGVGHFIRKTSLDEFPQFFNVLRGDMSLVGTRPPTQEEYAQYELNHKSRLAFKPGITAMWQISGRSDIVDFDEVIRLDTQYIERWTIMEDVRILIKTVLAVVGQKGSE